MNKLNLSCRECITVGAVGPAQNVNNEIKVLVPPPSLNKQLSFQISEVFVSNVFLKNYACNRMVVVKTLS